MFCSKCILKHTSQKHEVINCSPKGKYHLFSLIFQLVCYFCHWVLTSYLRLVLDMKRMVQEMITEVEVYESETPASEELYSKLELKVRKKFNDEIDRLEKSFRRIME